MLKFISRTFALIAIALFILALSPTISNKADGKNVVARPQTLVSKIPSVDVMVVAVVAAKDNRAEKLAAYFEAKGSPFTPYSKNFVAVADKYDLDWTLLPAIANLESQLGIQIPGNSYNPYGWNNGKFYFQSWADANEIVANALRTRYAPTGEVTSFRIGKMYAASPTWATRVAKNQLEILNW